VELQDLSWKYGHGKKLTAQSKRQNNTSFRCSALLHVKNIRLNLFVHMWVVIVQDPSRAQWLPPVIPAIREAEIRRIVVQSQPREIVCKTLSQKTHHKQKGW
jgi:hypothetical protein